MSDDVWVLLRPAAVYRRLVETDGYAAWKRPLFFAFLFGCAVSLATSGRVTLRLVAPAMVYAGLIPLLEIAALWALLRRGALDPVPEKPGISLGRAVDLFFMGHTAWCLWLLALAGICAFARPMQAFSWTGPPWGLATMGLVAAWSGYIDYCFFRCVSPGRAGRNLLMQRALCWSVGIAIFGGGSFWTGLVGVLSK